jgi:hypothetical protein
MKVSKYFHCGTCLRFKGRGRPPTNTKELALAKNSVTPAEINRNLMDAVVIYHDEVFVTCLSAWAGATGCMTELSSKTEFAQHRLLEEQAIPHL